MVLRPAMVERLLTKSVPAMVCAFLLVGCAFSPESTTPASLRSLIGEESALATETPIENDSTQAVQENVHVTATPDPEPNVPEVEPETAVVEITTDAMVIPPSVEAQLPKSVSVLAGPNEDFTVEIVPGKTPEDVLEFIKGLLVRHYCDSFRVVDCKLDELAEKMEGVPGIPAKNGILAVYNLEAENGFYDELKLGANKNLKFGDENDYLQIELRTYGPKELSGLGIGTNAGFALVLDSVESGRIEKIIIIFDRDRLNNRIDNYPALSDSELAIGLGAASNYIASSDPTSNNVVKEIRSPGQNNFMTELDRMKKEREPQMDLISQGQLLENNILVFRRK